jgi:deoxyribose-phosphate aldolase
MIDLSKITKETVGKLFDYSVLPKDATESDIRFGCKDAVKYGCAAFYSSSLYWVPVIKEELAGSDVLIATGINFPFGNSTPEVKAFETEKAVAAGCQALDMVMNIGALKDRRYQVVEEELKLFKTLANQKITKVILETCYLTDQEITTGCKLIEAAGIDFAKTSSGQYDGPSMEQVLLMKRTLENTSVRIKVSGVKPPRPQNAYCFIMAGAELIGTRAAPEIIEAFDQMRDIGIIPPYRP